ncbi:hypothetical protein D3C76_1541650 [compost metagenome]
MDIFLAQGLQHGWQILIPPRHINHHRHHRLVRIAAVNGLCPQIIQIDRRRNLLVDIRKRTPRRKRKSQPVGFVHINLPAVQPGNRLPYPVELGVIREYALLLRLIPYPCQQLRIGIYRRAAPHRHRLR